MSFMERFLNGAKGASGVQTQQNPAGSVDLSPTNPANAQKPDGVQAAIPKPTETLLDSYKDLNKPKAEGEAQGGIPVPVPDMNVDPTTIRGAMAGTNFLEGLSAEEIQKATKGDVEAFMKVIQHVGTTAASQAFAASATTTKRALGETTDRFNTLTLPELNRRRDSSALIRQDMPFFEHPAVAPMLSDMETRLHNAYPAASSQAIKEHAQKLMGGMFEQYAASQGKVLTDAPKLEGPGGRDKFGNEDWGANGYFEGADLGNPFN